MAAPGGVSCRARSTRCSRPSARSEQRARIARVFASRPDDARRLRDADHALGPGLGQRGLADASRPHLPHARRFATRLPPAARLARLHPAVALSLCGAAGSDRAARAPARPGPAHHHHGSRAPRSRSIVRPADHDRNDRAGPHRLRGRAARRPALRVHAARGPARGLSRTADGGRGRRRGPRPHGPHRGLRPALRPAPQRHQGDAGPRRHRGERAAGDGLGPRRRDHPRPLRGRARRCASAPTSS